MVLSNPDVSRVRFESLVAEQKKLYSYLFFLARPRIFQISGSFFIRAHEVNVVISSEILVVRPSMRALT